MTSSRAEGLHAASVPLTCWPPSSGLLLLPPDSDVLHIFRRPDGDQTADSSFHFLERILLSFIFGFHRQTVQTFVWASSHRRLPSRCRIHMWGGGLLQQQSASDCRSEQLPEDSTINPQILT